MKNPSVKKGIVVDHNRREIFVDGKEVYLPPSEYGILRALHEDGGVMTREELLRELGHVEEKIEVAARMIDQYVARARRKIGPGVIQTVVGCGYKIANNYRSV